MELPDNKELSGSQVAAVIEEHRNQRRCAWLWDAEGQNLIWQNDAARLYLAKKSHHRPKGQRLKLAKPAIPIQGQIHHLLRLGTLGVTSLARVRFLVGSKPSSATCSCTPIQIDDENLGLLIVAVEPIEPKLLKKLKRLDQRLQTLRIEKAQETEQTQASEKPKKPKETKKTQKSKNAKHKKDKKKEEKKSTKGQLSRLVDQLSHSSTLFEPLGPSEVIEAGESESLPEISEQFAQIVPDPAETGASKEPEQWRIIGRGFTPFPDGEPESLSKGAASDTPSGEAPSSEELERVAEYNFAELSRILEDKVGGAPLAEIDGVTPAQVEAQNAAMQSEHTTSNLTEIAPNIAKTINLSEEVLVLNRLPVGILIFRDQDILFANRALADMTGNSSISELKTAGLSAIFPRIDDPDSTLGPVLSLVDKSGNQVRVDARLQGINWRDRSALMLSALPANETSKARSDNSKAFVQAVTEAQNDGYFEFDRNGIVTEISQRALSLLQRKRKDVINQPFVDFVKESQKGLLREFMEKPSKTAETTLPFVEVESEEFNLGFELFSHGKAGIVQGYFGAITPLLNETEMALAPPKQGEVATLLLARLSRGIRRPLNTIMGFSELISGEAFGDIPNKRYVEYAGDIQNAGAEISHLTDELDEYARLEDEGFILDKSSFDLMQLLDECMGLVRNEANRQQVFVRSAISEELPNILADRGSLRQAILNLLASAIAQSPGGGKVILSAQIEDDGSVGVHVRDSSIGPGGIDERFVVFRQGDDHGEETMVTMKSSMGLALTRSLISVNSCALHVDPSAGTGTLMSLVIPKDLLDNKILPATN